MTTLLIIIALLLLPVLYDLLFPFRSPVLENYFTPGQTFTSTAEGVTQTVLKQEGDRVYCELKFEPGAAGPPEHMHIGFDESGTVVQGTLSVKNDGKFFKLYAGDRLILNKGLFHTMYNETSEVTIVRCDRPEDFMPVEFSYALAQLYPLFPADGKPSLKMIAKIAVLGDRFDSLIMGPPLILQKIAGRVIKPYARLFGITPYDAKSHPDGHVIVVRAPSHQEKTGSKLEV
jgi:quercetin dioxygenase-like cupin family protein